MTEHLLTVPEAAQVLRVTPWTLRKWLNEGTLQGVRPRPGGRWRVPQSALDRLTQTRTASKTGATEQSTGADTASTPETRAAAILDAMRSGDKERRNAAIIRLTRSDAATIEIVIEAAAQAVEAWDGPEEDFSAWQALDSKPHFPEEAPDYLDGLYRADDAEGQGA